MKTYVIIIAMVFLAILSQSSGNAQEVKYIDAPKVVPGSTEEMQKPDYWIARYKGDPDKVIMTPGEIAELNRKNQSKSYQFSDINGRSYSLLDRTTHLVANPLTIKTFPGDSLRVLFNETRSLLESRTYYDFRKRTWDTDMKNEVYRTMDENSIPDLIKPQYGIFVMYTSNKKIPSPKKGWEEPNGWLSSFDGPAINTGTPVAILHVSRDRDWYFVRSEAAFGWVPANHVAIGTAEEISAYVNDPNFVVVTVPKVPVYRATGSNTFLTDLYMGTRLKLHQKTPAGYQVRVPFRRSDGSFEEIEGLIKPDVSISVSYVPFTYRNVVTVFFGALYLPWATDPYDGLSCSRRIRAVLSCFGIKMISSTTFQLHGSDYVRSFPEDAPGDVKLKQLEACEPGIVLIGSPQHVIMYLGAVDGRHFVIHSTGYDYKSEDGAVVYLVRRVNVNDVFLAGGSHIDTWMYICELKK